MVVVQAMSLQPYAARGGHDQQQRVVVYTSVDRIFSEPVLREAGKRLGLEVVGVYDTEETKSTGLVNRLIAKKDNPDGDIFWSGDPARAVLLKSKGVTVAYDSPAAKEIPDAFKDPERHWIGFSARSRVLLVNTQLVPEGQEPRSILDLTDAKWKGKVAIANPLFGTTSFHVSVLFGALGDAQARQWLDDLKANGVQIVSSNGEVKRQVAGGQVAMGLTDSDDAAEAIKDGQPVRVVFLDQTLRVPDTRDEQKGGTPLGTLVIPNTLSLIKGGPSPDGARRVFDFLLSADVQRMLAESCAQAPLMPGVTAPSGVLSLDRIVPMKTDYARAADHLERLLPMLKEWAEKK
ncbi:MAG: extracellular solute-binding protein [Phycisphaerales bacterium]|nr:extracellular solute-binding protein [Phycisphaerales bacterium]